MIHWLIDRSILFSNHSGHLQVSPNQIQSSLHSIASVSSFNWYLSIHLSIRRSIVQWRILLLLIKFIMSGQSLLLLLHHHHPTHFYTSSTIVKSSAYLTEDKSKSTSPLLEPLMTLMTLLPLSSSYMVSPVVLTNLMFVLQSVLSLLN